MEKAIAVEIELEKRRYSLAGCNGELSIAICTAGHIDTVSQQVEGAHDHILWVPWKTQVKVPRQDLLLHVEEVFHQLGQHHALEQSGGNTSWKMCIMSKKYWLYRLQTSRTHHTKPA